MLHLPRKHSIQQRRATRVRKLVGCCAFLAVASAPLFAQGSGYVTAIRHWSQGDVTRIAIEIEANSGFHVRSDRLENPDRLFFDIVGAIPRLGKRGVRVMSVGDAFVRQIRVAETQRAVTRVVLDLDGPVEFTTSQLENPDRLIIEVRAPGHVSSAPRLETATLTLPSSAPPLRESPRPVERRIFQPPAVGDRATPEPAEVALLDTPPSVDTNLPKAASIPNTSPRISAPAPPRASRASGAVLAKVIPPPASSIATAPNAPPDLPVPARRNNSGDRSMVRVLGLKVGRIVLDAGHGGHDTGTVGPGGLTEKDLVLDVTKRLGALIDERLGAEVIYTRSDDTFIPLERRTEIANDAKADLFLSIHANSSPLRTAAGVETYYLSFTTSKTALDVAARENASSEKSIYELQDLLQKIALKDKVDESRDFATRIQDSLFSASVKTNPRARDRGVRKAPFVVLIGASMPSVLAEIGFISNAHDETLMSRTDHRQRIAEALYKGLSSYAATLSHFQVAQRRP